MTLNTLNKLYFTLIIEVIYFYRPSILNLRMFCCFLVFLKKYIYQKTYQHSFKYLTHCFFKLYCKHHNQLNDLVKHVVLFNKSFVKFNNFFIVIFNYVVQF